MIPTLEISDDRMTSPAHHVVADRVSVDPELWTVTGRHGVYSREQAKTAMTIAELHAHKLPSPNDSIMIEMFEQELLVPVMPTDPWALLQTLKNAATAVRRLAESHRPTGPEGPQIGTWLLRIGETLNELTPALKPLIATAGGQVLPETPDDPWHEIKSDAGRVKDVIGWAGDALRQIGWTAQHADHTSRARGGKHWGPIQLHNGETVYGWTCDPTRYPDLHAQLMDEQGFAH